MGGASLERGLVHYELAEGRAFKAADVTTFLGNLKAKCSPDMPFTVFWDNCSIHTTKVVQIFCEAEEINLITNVSYRPELNGIEHVWAWAKHVYRGKLDRFKALEEDWDQSALVKQILQEVPMSIAMNSIRRGWQNIEKA